MERKCQQIKWLVLDGHERRLAESAGAGGLTSIMGRLYPECRCKNSKLPPGGSLKSISSYPLRFQITPLKTFIYVCLFTKNSNLVDIENKLGKNHWPRDSLQTVCILYPTDRPDLHPDHSSLSHHQNRIGSYAKNLKSISDYREVTWKGGGG